MMRKIIMLNRISLDGFFAGPNGEIDWFIHDFEVDKFVHEGGVADTLLMGRLTYQMFEKFWPSVLKDPYASKDMLNTAQELNDMTKIVFSKSLDELTWENSELIKENPLKKVKELKAGKGTAIMIFGSGTIVQELANEGLIDEYIFIVTPVVLGEGKLLFKNVKHFDLKLLKTRGFKSGNVVLHYETVR